uniref:Uncharacterized protein n=1 Tax=Oryza barthii TaxID=65489 RepID=A0A0D3GTU6_9ORYZ
MAETEARLCTRYGAAAAKATLAKATLARNILAPVAGRLSGHPSELHRRCILLRRLSSSRNTGTTADLASRPPVEAVAVSGALRTAVVVFETVAGWRAAAAATLSASCDTVPPLYFGPPIVLVDGRDIKVFY